MPESHAPASRKQQFVLFRGLQFPFQQPTPGARLWWVLFFAYVPMLDFVVFRGWRLAIVQRIVRGEQPFLPSLGGLPRYCLNGVILWAMTALYLLPGALLLILFGGSLATYILDVAWWLIERFLLWREVAPFWTVVGRGLLHVGAEVSSAAIYFLVMGPAYRAGMLHYAAGGGVTAFLNFPRNVLTVLRDPGAFYGVWVLDRVFWIVWMAIGMATLSILGGVLATTVVLAPLAPVIGVAVIGSFLTVYYWTTAYLYGQLGLRLKLLSSGPPAFCVGCGAAIKPGGKFCAGCGRAVT